MNLSEVLKRCKAEGVIGHRYIGYGLENIEAVLPYTDLFLYDLKNMNSELQRVIGVPNEEYWKMPVK